MEKLSPAGGVYQAGTLTGNPLVMTVGIETLKLLKRDGFYRELEEKSARLAPGIVETAKKAAFPIYSTRVGSMFCAFFTGGEVRDWPTASTCDTGAFCPFI